MRVRTTLRWIGAGALALAMGVPATASAATISVDDDRLDCPSAPYTSVQAAVDAASPGDVIAICPGTYEEGPATVPAGGANAVSIAKMLTIRGAGASKVTIKPRPALASLLGTTTNYRNNFGSVIGVYRSGVRQIVDISGVTVEGGVTTVGSAVKFYNAEGSLTGSVIRSVAPLTGPQGYGVVIASNLVADRVPVRVAGVSISGYAKAGVVIDSTQAAPALGILAATVQANTITGAGPQAQTGQQGVLATGLATGAISGNVIADNLGSGDAASAGVRLVDLDLTPTTVGGTTTKLTATGNNIVNNGYGVRNETGAGADQAIAFTATGNWWGHVAGPSIGLPQHRRRPGQRDRRQLHRLPHDPDQCVHGADRGHRLAPDGRDRPARRGAAWCDLHPARARRRRLRRQIGRVRDRRDHDRHRHDRAVQRGLDAGSRAGRHDRDADGDGHRLVGPDVGLDARRAGRGPADAHAHADTDRHADADRDANGYADRDTDP